MRKSLLAIFTLVCIQARITGSYAEPPPNHPSQLHYDPNGEASAKTSSIATLATGRIPRQSRCIRCTYPYEDRYGGTGTSGYRGYADDYYGRQYAGGNRYYDSAAASRGSSYDDRNWYYYPERYDDRMNRYPDRYGSSALNVVEPTAPKKYDDRYASRTYDRYDAPIMGYYDRYNDYRGNGYDNRDYYRGGDAAYYRDQSYDRYRGASTGYGGFEGRYNDRDTYYRPSYDYRNYRPWDDTYSGQSDYDNSGRGYYFASRPDDVPPPLGPSSFHYRPAPPLPPYSRPDDERNSYPRPPSRPYSPHAPSRPHHLPDSPNKPGSSSRIPGDSSAPPSSSSSSSAGSSSSSLPSSSSQSASGPGAGSGGSSASSSHHYQYNDRPGRPDDDPNRGYAGHWTYLNDREKDSGYHQDREQDRNRDRDMMSADREKDPQSAQYGPRPRPLGGAYLLDRDSNSPIAVNSDDNKDNKMVDQTKVSAIEANNEGINGGSGASSSPLVGTSSDSIPSGDNTKN